MRGRLSLLIVALIFSALAALLAQAAGVTAIGAPTDNSTVLNIPANDQSQNEVKPAVDYVLEGPTSQSASSPPNFILGFMGTAGQDKFQITANENWYLDVDINMPGWLYIYEYFPGGQDFAGKWIAYKWQLSQSGLWRLGPFTPEDNELEGQHIYRVWFYGDGEWAMPDPNTPHSNLVYWTYSRVQPAGQVPQPPAKETTFLERLQTFITKPVVLVTAPPLLVIIVMLSLYLTGTYPRRRRGQNALPPTMEDEAEAPSAALTSTVARAKIALPNGVEIQFTGDKLVIGRGDLARALGLDELGLISRRHFEVKSEEEQFYIEDLGTANGTKLNGTDISSQGPVILNDNDVIEPADAIRLKFYVL